MGWQVTYTSLQVAVPIWLFHKALKWYRNIFRHLQSTPTYLINNFTKFPSPWPCYIIKIFLLQKYQFSALNGGIFLTFVCYISSSIKVGSLQKCSLVPYSFKHGLTYEPILNGGSLNFILISLFCVNTNNMEFNSFKRSTFTASCIKSGQLANKKELSFSCHGPFSSNNLCPTNLCSSKLACYEGSPQRNQIFF